MARISLLELLKDYLLEQEPEDQAADVSAEDTPEETPEENQPIRPEPEPETDQNKDAISPDLPSGPISIDDAKSLIKDTNGGEFAVKFIKKDNTSRVMTATLIPAEKIKGNPRYNAASKGLMPVMDTAIGEIRIINLKTLQSLTIGNKTYTLSPSTVTEEIKRMRKLASIEEAEERPYIIKSISHYEDIFNMNKREGRISSKMISIINNIIADIKKNGSYATEKEAQILSNLKNGLYTKK